MVYFSSTLSGPLVHYLHMHKQRGPVDVQSIGDLRSSHPPSPLPPPPPPVRHNSHTQSSPPPPPPPHHPRIQINSDMYAHCPPPPPPNRHNQVNTESAPHTPLLPRTSMPCMPPHKHTSHTHASTPPTHYSTPTPTRLGVFAHGGAGVPRPEGSVAFQAHALGHLSSSRGRVRCIHSRNSSS